MRIIKNKISEIPAFKSQIDNTSDLPFIPHKPLPVKSFLLYINGSPGSGKTSLMMSLLTSHPSKKNKDKNLYYYKFFDNIHLISASLQTLPHSFLKQLPDEKKHNKYNDDLMEDIIENLKEGDNDNNLIVLDDVIKDLNRSKILSKIFLNRRHITHNEISHLILFKISSAPELKRVREEVCYDLTEDEFKTLTKLAWKNKYDFLFIDLNKPKNDKYYIKFDKVIFDEDDDDELLYIEK
jgi:Cdc6-like AAA superfamily ATPase